MWQACLSPPLSGRPTHDATRPVATRREPPSGQLDRRVKGDGRHVEGARLGARDVNDGPLPDKCQIERLKHIPEGERARLRGPEDEEHALPRDERRIAVEASLLLERRQCAADKEEGSPVEDQPRVRPSARVEVPRHAYLALRRRRRLSRAAVSVRQSRARYERKLTMSSSLCLKAPPVRSMRGTCRSTNA